MPRAIPGRRYYGGCEHVDAVEDLARDRAKQLFGAEHANVQPHSGTQANMAVYLAAARAGRHRAGPRPGPRRPPDARHEAEHLGQAVPLSSATALRRDTHRIDFDQVAALAREHKPKLIVAGASAYPREIPHAQFAEIARDVRRQAVRRHGPLRRAWWPPACTTIRCPVADFVTTTTHKTLRGPRGGLILCRAEYAKDLDRTVFPGIQGGPLMHVIAGKAVCFGEALQPRVQGNTPGRSSTTPRPWPTRSPPAACGWSAAAPTTT